MSYPAVMMMGWDRSEVRAGSASRRRPGVRGRVRLHPGAMVARFKVPDGWAVQAFTFALDCTPEQAACINRQFGGRRYARNWAVRTLREDLDRYHAAGEETGKPSLPGLWKRWNQVKGTECVDAETGQVWWPEISKEAFADGIKAAVDGYWNWQASRAGKRAGRRVGFPRFAKKDRDRVTFTTGAIRIEPDRRHVTLPRVWTCGQSGTRHQRDDNAAVNLARYEPPAPGDSAVGPVGAAVKRRADRKTGPRPAGGREARKGRSRTAAEQPRDGVPV
jgi:transposase